MDKPICEAKNAKLKNNGTLKQILRFLRSQYFFKVSLFFNFAFFTLQIGSSEHSGILS